MRFSQLPETHQQQVQKVLLKQSESFEATRHLWKDGKNETVRNWFLTFKEVYERIIEQDMEIPTVFRFWTGVDLSQATEDNVTPIAWAMKLILDDAALVKA